MEAEQLPQKIKIAEMESIAKAKEEGYQVLEKQHKSVQEDNQAINTLLQLSKSQLDTSIQANKVLEARALSAGSS